MLIRWLVFLMFAVGLQQFGMMISELSLCRSRACLQQIEKHSRDVLNIDWKPISIFPEEAKQFR